MRILLAHHLPLDESGPGHYTQDVAQSLIAAGHEVRLLVVDSRRRSDDGLTVRRIVCQVQDGEGDLAFPLPGFGPQPSRRLAFAGLSNAQLDAYRDHLRGVLDAEVDQFNPQVIHAQHVWLWGQLALESGVPYVLTAWGPEFADDFLDPRLHDLAVQAAENASRILVGNERLRQQVIANFDGVAERTVLHTPAIELAASHSLSQATSLSREELLAGWGLPPDTRQVIAYAGQLSPERGVDVLLNAAARYETSLPHAATVIAGDGPQRRELELQSQHLGLKRITWAGTLCRADVARLLSLADVAVVPSRTLRSGVGVLEALSLGTPVIASEEGGAEQLVAGDLGRIVPAGDHELLADAIEQALRENWKSRAKGVAVERVRTRHAMSNSVAALVLMYQAVLDERFGRLP